MSKFAQRVDIAVDALSSNPPKDVDDNDFIDASRLVYDGVREIRRAVLMNRVRDFCSYFIFQSSFHPLAKTQCLVNNDQLFNLNFNFK